MIGAPPRLPLQTAAPALAASGLAAWGTRPLAIEPPAGGLWSLPVAGALLVALPVFLQAPWVRLAPFSAALFTAALLLAGVVMAQRRSAAWSTAGVLLVGFSGSWLGGCLFWGWFRVHPLWPLPIEAFALPLAVAGLFLAAALWAPQLSGLI